MQTQKARFSSCLNRPFICVYCSPRGGCIRVHLRLSVNSTLVYAKTFGGGTAPVRHLAAAWLPSGPAPALLHEQVNASIWCCISPSFRACSNDFDRKVRPFRVNVRLPPFQVGRLKPRVIGPTLEHPLARRGAASAVHLQFPRPPKSLSRGFFVLGYALIARLLTPGSVKKILAWTSARSSPVLSRAPARVRPPVRHLTCSSIYWSRGGRASELKARLSRAQLCRCSSWRNGRSERPSTVGTRFSPRALLGDGDGHGG